MSFEITHGSHSGRAIKTEHLVPTTADSFIKLTTNEASMDHPLPERKIFQRLQKIDDVIDLTEDSDTEPDDTITGQNVAEMINNNQHTTDRAEEELLKNYALKCGHDSSKFVDGLCLMPCNTLLLCGDICSGNCHTCSQGRIHVPCTEPCRKLLICGHICNVPCKDYCPPCNRTCYRSCPHGTCTKICGLPCERCEEPCEWRCAHLWCSQLCDAPCDRYLCPMGCHIQLPCGHSCVGVCGELCPPCRTCSPDSFPSIFSADEEEAQNARFIVLLPCKHCVEVTVLDKWLSMKSSGRVQMIAAHTCPVCSSIITNRNLPLVKDSFCNIREVMINIHGEPRELIYKQVDIQYAIKKLQKFRTDLEAGPSRSCNKVQLFTHAEEKILFMYLENNGLEKNGYFAFSFVVYCLQNILTCVTSHWNCYEEKHQLNIKSHVMFLMKQMLKHVSQFGKQQHCDFSNETRRFVHFAYLRYLYNKPGYKVNKDKPEMQGVLQFALSILDPKPYTIHKEVEAELKEFEKRINAAPSISDEEKNIIFTAFPEYFRAGERAQRHAYKCSEGHVYLVGECGNPVQKSQCPVCKEAIGVKEGYKVSSSSRASKLYRATELDRATEFDRPTELDRPMRCRVFRKRASAIDQEGRNFRRAFLTGIEVYQHEMNRGQLLKELCLKPNMNSNHRESFHTGNTFPLPNSVTPLNSPKNVCSSQGSCGNLPLLINPDSFTYSRNIPSQLNVTMNLRETNSVVNKITIPSPSTSGYSSTNLAVPLNLSYNSGQDQNSLNMSGISSLQYLPSEYNMYPNIMRSIGGFLPSTSHQSVMRSQFGATEHTSTSSSNLLSQATTNVPSLTYRTDETITIASDPASHGFPQDPETRKKWIIDVRRKCFDPADHSRICSKHFTEDCCQIRPNASYPLLNSDALPTINEFPPNVGPPLTKKRHIIKKCEIDVSTSKCAVEENDFHNTPRKKKKVDKNRKQPFIIKSMSARRTKRRLHCFIKVLQERLKRRAKKISSMKRLILLLKKRLNAPEKLTEVMSIRGHRILNALKKRDTEILNSLSLPNYETTKGLTFIEMEKALQMPGIKFKPECTNTCIGGLRKVEDILIEYKETRNNNRCCDSVTTIAEKLDLEENLASNPLTVEAEDIHPELDSSHVEEIDVSTSKCAVEENYFHNTPRKMKKVDKNRKHPIIIKSPPATRTKRRLCRIIKVLQQRLKRRGKKISSMKQLILLLKKRLNAPERLSEIYPEQE